MPLDGHQQDTIADLRQPFPLPPDARYVLDNMLDDWQLDEGSYIALNLFTPREPVLAIIDNKANVVLKTGADLAGPICYRDRSLMATGLLDLADDTMRQLPQHAFDGLAQFSLSWLRRDIYGLAEVFSMWVHEDETEGGCLKAFRRGRHRRINRNGNVWARTARRIRSPAFIARFVKQQKESLQRRIMAGRLLDRVQRAGSLAGAPFDIYATELAAQREAARVESIRRFGLTQLEQAVDQFGGKKKLRRALRKRRRRDRSVIKRALNVASAVLSDDDIRAFGRGDGVRLPGQTLDLIVKLAGGIADRGHGALVVYVTRPGDSSVLAHLCTYVEDTPALDQLVAFALAMKAGEEALVIRDANITAMLPEGREHPLLAEREQKRLTNATGNSESWTRVGGRDHWSYDEKRAREQAYWAETKAVWLERLGVFACGRRVKLLGTA